MTPEEEALLRALDFGSLAHIHDAMASLPRESPAPVAYVVDVMQRAHRDRPSTLEFFVIDLDDEAGG